MEKREDILNQLQLGDPIHLKGHVVMYLGKLEENHYIIHTDAGYEIKDKDGRVRLITVHGIFISRSTPITYEW